jgi:hypothetical protein
VLACAVVGWRYESKTCFIVCVPTAVIGLTAFLQVFAM